MKSYIVSGLLLLISGTAFGQGSVELITDPSVDALETARLSKRKSLGANVHGYRIMIAFYASRQDANAKLAEARSLYDNSYETTLLYDEPNFKVYVGTFTAKADAEAALVQIRKKYPGARIINDLVPAPRVH